MLLQDDPLVDVFVFLCRAVLDTLEITNRRFKILVQKRAKGVCLREIEVAELWADPGVDRSVPPVTTAKLVTGPTRIRDGSLQRETFILEDVPLEEICSWFVNRLRHSVVKSQAHFIMPTDTSIESMQGTVILEKGLRWIVRHTIDVDNAFKFLESFTGLEEVKLWSHQRSFRFGDDWFKLFEALALYRVTLIESTCTASTESLISFLFGASTAPSSQNRMVDVPEWHDRDTKSLEILLGELIEAALNCTSTNRTTFFLHNLHGMRLLNLLAKYVDVHDSRTMKRYNEPNGRTSHRHYGRVFNLHDERFRVQVFCHSGGLQIRRALEDVEGDFFPEWLEADTGSDHEF